MTPRQAFIFTSGHTYHLQEPPLFNIDFKKQLLRPALGVASTFETRQTEFITKDEKRRCVFHCQSLSAGVSHCATAALICCLSMPRTGECGAITREQRHSRLSHFTRAHSLSMKKRCSISLPAKWTARVLQKAHETEDLVSRRVPSPSCPVSSVMWSERNAGISEPKATMWSEV